MVSLKFESESLWGQECPRIKIMLTKESDLTHGSIRLLFQSTMKQRRRSQVESTCLYFYHDNEASKCVWSTLCKIILWFPTRCWDILGSKHCKHIQETISILLFLLKQNHPASSMWRTFPLHRCWGSLLQRSKGGKQLVLVLARFVLTHYYISCPEVMVVYANIHLLFVETNIIYTNLQLQCLFQVLFLINRRLKFLCHASGADFQEFSQAFNDVDPSIKFVGLCCHHEPSSWIF